jgi:hypothetical protein
LGNDQTMLTANHAVDGVMMINRVGAVLVWFALSFVPLVS